MKLPVSSLAKAAYEMMKTDAHYLEDARRFSNVNNTVIGSLLSLRGYSRWVTEEAVKQALKTIEEEAL